MDIGTVQGMAVDAKPGGNGEFATLEEVLRQEFADSIDWERIKLKNPLSFRAKRGMTVFGLEVSALVPRFREFEGGRAEGEISIPKNKTFSRPD